MVEVRTRFGPVRGRQTGATLTFTGVPYAAPPVGEGRWRAPQPLTPWRDVCDATGPANRAFQLPFPSTLNRGEIPGAMNEDMLQLNIYTPGSDAGGRPVLVYIHGGGYTAGSANDFDPSPFVERHDIVVVCINYRLGLFGFLDLSRFGSEYAGSAALGFQDQIAALDFIRHVIADFGGDPDNLTVCGVSAGAGSVLALMGAPRARGLFARAMAFSPGEISRSVGDSFSGLASALGLPEAEALARLQAMSGADLFALQTRTGISGGACVDGNVVAAPIEEAIARGINATPLIIGVCRDEGTMLVPSIEEYDLPNLDLIILGIGHTISAGQPERYAAYLDAHSPAGDQRARMTRFWYDYFRAPTVRAAQACAAVGVPAWVYRFEVATDHPFGPTHASDMAFTFSLFDAFPEGQVVGFHPNTAENRRLAGIWSSAVARFVRHGDPNGTGIPQWPTYAPGRRASLAICASPEVVYDADSAAALQAYGAS